MKDKKIIIILIAIAIVIILCIAIANIKGKNNQNKTGDVNIEQKNDSIQVPERELPDENKDIILYVGEDTKYTQIQAKYNAEATKEDQIKRILDKIGIEIGYKIETNKITIEENRIIINFKSNSAPFDDSAYFGNESADVFVNDYKTLVYRVFDSIKMTLTKVYGENWQIYYCMDGKEITFNNINPRLTISSNKPYNGANE